MKLKVSVGSKAFSIEILGDSGILTLGELRCKIAEEADLNCKQMKIIHRGKSLSGDDSSLLEQLIFKENDKLLVMGRAKVALKANI
uniref:Ubiquitin_5 domain-containing protein n=1 Tax=Heterorhabditis bacteriophora TaxID=37862 RepID=A0A1I7WTS6_HETBA